MNLDNDNSRVKIISIFSQLELDSDGEIIDDDSETSDDITKLMVTAAEARNSPQKPVSTSVMKKKGRKIATTKDLDVLFGT